MKIFNSTKKTVIAQEAKLADTFLSRFIGLLNRSSLDSGEALVITRCQSIHMLFMRFSIDAIFVDSNNCVVGLVKGIRPFQLSPLFFKSSYCIEVETGGIQKSTTAVGDYVKMEE